MPLTTYTAGEVLTAASLNANFSFVEGASGLTLVKTQTIGTTVASVAVTDAFSSTYDSYKIIVTGGVGSTGANMNLQFGATTTGYYSAVTRTSYSAGAVTGIGNNNGANFAPAGDIRTTGIMMDLDVLAPNLARPTIIGGPHVVLDGGGNAGHVSGFLNDNTAYTGFTILVGAGTITGGTIKIYGYKN
jgi:hypothetical protein